MVVSGQGLASVSIPPSPRGEEPQEQLTSKEYDFHGRMIKNLFGLPFPPTLFDSSSPQGTGNERFTISHNHSTFSILMSARLCPHTAVSNPAFPHL